MIALGEGEDPTGKRIIERAWPALAGATMIGLTTSGVQPVYLSTFGHSQAVVVQVVYGLLFLFVAVRPNSGATIHRVGAVFAVAIFVGKALGFASLVLDGQTNLVGPVGERLLLAMALFVWHLTRVRKAVYDAGNAVS